MRGMERKSLPFVMADGRCLATFGCVGALLVEKAFGGDA